MLAEQVDGVIGVDTHRDTLAAAAVSPIGAVLASTDSPANALGYQQLLDFARQHIPGRRCWALEGTGSYGAGLAAFLTRLVKASSRCADPSVPRSEAGARPTCLMLSARPGRPWQPNISSTHDGAVSARHFVSYLPPVLACTAAINLLKALITSAPDELRVELRGMKSKDHVAHCTKLRDRPSQDIEHRMTVRALRSAAQRTEALRSEAKELEAELLALVRTIAPELLALQGVGPISAAQILISWSHTGRFRSEAAFAAFAGVAPIPASSGLTNRHRTNRSGDRQLNRALHTITLIRIRLYPTTRAYVARRISEGRPRETHNAASSVQSVGSSSSSSNEEISPRGRAPLKISLKQLDLI
ncbi:transposase [Streptomyces sp. NPDC054847]